MGRKPMTEEERKKKFEEEKAKWTVNENFVGMLNLEDALYNYLKRSIDKELGRC